MSRIRAGLISGVWVSLVFVAVFGLVLNVPVVRAGGTIYIRADGSIDPPTAPITTVDNVIYTFADNINDSIVVERSNIIIDGAGYTLQFSGSGTGLDLESVNNVTIKNTNIKGFSSGAGVGLHSSSSNVITGNNITNNSYSYGIYLGSSSNNRVSGNNITNNGYGIALYYSSNDNSISGNNITATYYFGIVLYSSSNNNSISGNNITNNGDGIYLEYSSNDNSISGNNITANNGEGIYFYSSSNNRVSGNNITNNGYGIALWWNSSNNSISGNNITANNNYGIALSYSSSNSIYHNNFIGNTEQVDSYDSTNIWDDYYPFGGNYWSDYSGADLHSGPYQNETGTDGIGDTPYTYWPDRYPLINPIGSLQPPIAIFTYSPEHPAKDETVTFDATSSYDRDGTITSYNWNFGDGNVTSVTTPTITHVYSTPGTYTINLTVTDNDGLSHSTTKSITVIDTTPPTTTHDYDGLWHTSDFAITLKATDDMSGVAETYYKINNEPTKTVSADGQPLITTEGVNNNKLEYWSIDNAGNEESHHILTGVKLDKIYPTIETPSRTPDGDVSPDQSVKVSANVTDATSQVKNVTLYYTTDNGNTWTDLPMSNTVSNLYEATIPQQEAGIAVRFKIVAYDHAGNNATLDGTEPYYVYQVIPEFPTAMILPLFMAFTVLAIIFVKRRKLKTHS